MTSSNPASAARRNEAWRQAGRALAAAATVVALAGCEDKNTFVAPPPPKVDVATPVQRPVTRYIEATGNTAPIKSVDLVARVQGFLQSIDYQDGTFVKQGTQLFTIEPETYKLKVEQAKAAEVGAQATVKQAEADFKRQVELVQRQAVSQSTLDTSTSTRDNAQANLQQAQVNTRLAEVNYGYTRVTAPFDGIVSAHLVSIGELVGVSSPTQLATIVAMDPIWVNFTVNEQDVLRIRAEAARRGLTPADMKQFPIQVGLQTETGYPHEGKLDYVSPTLNTSTGTLAVRGVVPNDKRVLLPRLFRPGARALRPGEERPARPRHRARQRPGRPLSAGGQRRQRRRAAQGADRPGRQRAARHRKRLEAGRPRRHRGTAAGDPGPEDRSANNEDRAAAGVCQVGSCLP
ncbi:RND family efflux transporter MFP subunit [Bradyrhizobium ottawaense]